MTGGIKYDNEVRNRLPKSGWNVDIFSLPSEPKGHILKRHLVSNFRITRMLLPLISKGEIVIEEASFHSRLFLFNLMAGLLRSARFVAIVHHMDYPYIRAGSLFKTIDKHLAAVFLRRTHHVVVVSEATKREVMHVGVPEERISIVPDAYDRPLKLDFKRNDNRLQLLFVGTCHPRKGLEYLLDAMRQLCDQDIILNLVGNLEDDIEYTQYIKSMVKEYGMERKVILNGWISQKELWRMYTKADIFVLPSLWEGFGIVLLEAMSFGLPIVATNTGAIPELIENESNGLLVPARDSKMLTRAIVRLINSPDLREELGRNGMARSKDALTWEQVSKRFSEVLETLV
jgi:glycosyltransferase involved in cell wall biosynthesis